MAAASWNDHKTVPPRTNFSHSIEFFSNKCSSRDSIVELFFAGMVWNATLPFSLRTFVPLNTPDCPYNCDNRKMVKNPVRILKTGIE